MPRASYAYLPRTGGNFVYAVEFEGGLVKVGCTANPRVRMSSLATRMRRRVRRCVVQPVTNPSRMYSAEELALRICRRLAAASASAEVFKGLPFRDAVMAIRHGERRSRDVYVPRSSGRQSQVEAA